MQKLSIKSLDGYDPNRLLNALIRALGLRTDARLARALGVQFMLVQKVRCMEVPVTSGLLIRMEEISGWSARTLRDLMGDRRRRFRFLSPKKSTVDEIISEIYANARLKKLC